MGCQITKPEDEKRSDQQSNAENASDTMAQKSTSETDYKSRLEWKICLVRNFIFNKIFLIYKFNTY